MPYRRSYRAYGRRRRRPGASGRRQTARLRVAAGGVSSARYYDLHTDRQIHIRAHGDPSRLGPDDFLIMNTTINQAGQPFVRGSSIWKTWLPMSIGTGYGFIREQAYKLHGFQARFIFGMRPDAVGIPPSDSAKDTGFPAARSLRLVMFFDTAGYGTVMPDADPAALFGEADSLDIHPTTQFKGMFRDANRFKIVADKRFTLKSQIVRFTDNALPTTNQLLCCGDRRIIDVNWRSPKPVLVRVNDTLNSSTSVGNLQLYCALLQDVHTEPAWGNIFPVTLNASARIYFSNP